MEAWMWISLWVVQTIVGAVLWRKLFRNEFNDSFTCLSISGLILPNILFILACLSYLTYKLVDYLGGMKKTEENDNI